MNREILFRGKRVDNGEWVEGWIVNNNNDDIAIQMKLSWDLFEVIPESVGQYTGLKDKSNKKIFEGDIVESLWDKLGSGFEPEKCTDVIEYINNVGFVPIHFSSHYNFKIIGNTTDKKELLK